MTILLGTMHVTSGVHHIAYQTTAKHISNSQVLLSISSNESKPGKTGWMTFLMLETMTLQFED